MLPKNVHDGWKFQAKLNWSIPFTKKHIFVSWARFLQVAQVPFTKHFIARKVGTVHKHHQEFLFVFPYIIFPNFYREYFWEKF